MEQRLKSRAASSSSKRLPSFGKTAMVCVRSCLGFGAAYKRHLVPGLWVFQEQTVVLNFINLHRF